MVPVAFNVGLETILPAVAALYQITVCPTGTVAVAVKVCIGEFSHCVMFPPDNGALGAASMVSTTGILVTDLQVPSSVSP